VFIPLEKLYYQPVKNKDFQVLVQNHEHTFYGLTLEGGLGLLLNVKAGLTLDFLFRYDTFRLRYIYEYDCLGNMYFNDNFTDYYLGFQGGMALDLANILGR